MKRKKKINLSFACDKHIPTFLGARLNMRIHNNMFTWPNMESIKF